MITLDQNNSKRNQHEVGVKCVRLISFCINQYINKCYCFIHYCFAYIDKKVRLLIVPTNDNETSILYDDVNNGVRSEQMQNICMTPAIICTNV